MVRYLRWRMLVGCAAVSVVLLASCGFALAALPDNRAFELVSPVEKGGLSLLANLAVPDASGEHVVVDGGSKNALLSTGVSWELKTRTATGWDGMQIGPPPAGEANFAQQSHVSFNAVSQDFSRFAFQTWMPLNPRDSTNAMGEYVRSGPAGPLVWASAPPAPVVPVSEPQECEGGLEPFFCMTNGAVFAGASADLRDVVWGEFHPLVAPPASLPGYPVDTHEHSYEVYESVDGVDELVGLVPASGEHECTRGGCVVPDCGAAMGNVGAVSREGFAPVKGAVSGDGSQVIFTSPDPAHEESAVGCTAPEVYVRENGASTLDVSASERHVADPAGPQKKVYAGSSEEGEKLNTVFFTSSEELTDDANTGGADEGKNLYAYTMPTSSQPGVLKDLTPENNTPNSTSKAVELTYLGASRNGKMVYFTASSALTGKPNSHGEAAQPGASNLYLYDASTGLTTFIAPGRGIAGLHIGLSYGENIAAVLGRLTSQVTPDGQHMVFTSSEPLTGYDNVGPECEGKKVNGVPVRHAGPCAEVYLYTAATGGLVCVSCNPFGAAPVGSARLTTRFLEGYLDNSVEPGTLPSPVTMSDDGSRVFFSSPDRLTAEAPTPTTTRGEPAEIAEGWEFEPNVYEYEKGAIHLIAPAALLLNATPSGQDVFFDTYGQLVPQDRDGSPDVYDARVNGGFPVISPPACSGSSCQGTPAPATVFATPPSETVAGVDDYPPVVVPKPKSCKRGFVLRKKKCVKPAKRRKAKHTRHGRTARDGAARGKRKGR